MQPGCPKLQRVPALLVILEVSRLMVTLVAQALSDAMSSMGFAVKPMDDSCLQP